ncbi:MAG TPA: TatD family hydrolase [Saprospiraceae bacterium]|nr:TatD family hydrolase [Saprospiraceae bacterium]
MFFNLHTHQPSLAPGTVEVESVYFGQEKAPVSSRRSVGLHPWHLSGFDLQTAEIWLREQAARPEIIAIGEAGLDKVVSTPWSLQVAAFQCCYNISEQFRKPLIIHCVRAFGEILDLKKQWKPAQPWIFHGFEKNAETARMLLNAGNWLSFGAALFRQNSHATEALRQTPADRFFLETDVSDYSIEQVYERAATIREIAPEDLTQQLQTNFEALFG